jgi:SpoIID/LytB domain protein
MSQTGADSMAKEGKTCEEIIKHFYTGVEIIEY